MATVFFQWDNSLCKGLLAEGHRPALVKCFVSFAIIQYTKRDICFSYLLLIMKIIVCVHIYSKPFSRKLLHQCLLLVKYRVLSKKVRWVCSYCRWYNPVLNLSIMLSPNLPCHRPLLVMSNMTDRTRRARKTKQI